MSIVMICLCIVPTLGLIRLRNTFLTWKLTTGTCLIKYHKSAGHFNRFDTFEIVRTGCWGVVLVVTSDYLWYGAGRLWPCWAGQYCAQSSPQQSADNINTRHQGETERDQVNRTGSSHCDNCKKWMLTETIYQDTLSDWEHRPYSLDYIHEWYSYSLVLGNVRWKLFAKWTNQITKILHT